MIYKSLLFSLLVLAFGIIEHLVEGGVHKQGLLGGLQRRYARPRLAAAPWPAVRT